MDVKIKKLYEDAKIPTYGTPEAACADLYAYLPDDMEGVKHYLERKYIDIEPHTTVKINTGLAMELPDCYCALIYARSGLATKLGLNLANSVGCCDSDYRGPYIVPLHNISDETHRIYHGERIAQVMFVPYIPANFITVEYLSSTERGLGGFGSTGTM